MTIPDISTLKVLCIDDSPIILSGITYMLEKTGFTKRNVAITSSAKDAIQRADEVNYDIYICDYNLSDTLNGKQVFEELKNKKLIKASTIFIIISSESDTPTVKSILELNPDDYLLKPFNFVELKARLLAIIRRKYTLLPIFEAEYAQNYEEGVPRCEELESFYPQYYFTIQRYKAKYLSGMKEYSKAESVYKNTLKQKNVDWAKLGLANTFVKSNRNKEAFEIINKMLKKKPHHAEAHIEMSSIHLKTNHLPKAISHLQLANKLIPGNSDRELVITNLCNAVEDYENALEHYRVYVKINENTFRNNAYTHFNFLRQILYAALDIKIGSKKILTAEAERVAAYIASHYDVANTYKDQMQVSLAHIALAKGKLKDAATLLQEVAKNNTLEHYYDCYHFAWVLNEMSFYTEFDPIIEACMGSMVGTLDTQGVHDIVESQMQMAQKLKAQKYQSTQKLVQYYKDASTLKQEGEMSRLLMTYIEMQRSYPYLGNVAYQIVQLLAQIWPEGLDTNQVSLLIKECDFVVKELYEMDDPETQQYKRVIADVYKQLEKRTQT